MMKDALERANEHIDMQAGRLAELEKQLAGMCPCDKMVQLVKTNGSLSDAMHQLANECEKLRAAQGDLRGMRRIYTKGYHAKGGMGRLISWFNNSGGISHVPTLIYSRTVDLGSKVLWEIEADSKKGVIGHEHDKAARSGDYYYCEVTIEQYRMIVAAAEGLVGKRYDKPGIMGFVTRKRMEDPERWFCSESQAHVMEQGGMPISRKPAWKTAPYDCVSSIRWTPCKQEEVVA